jgi:hypothetical protein
MFVTFGQAIIMKEHAGFLQEGNADSFSSLGLSEGVLVRACD